MRGKTKKFPWRRTRRFLAPEFAMGIKEFREMRLCERKLNALAFVQRRAESVFGPNPSFPPSCWVCAVSFYPYPDKNFTGKTWLEAVEKAMSYVEDRE